MFQTTKKTQKNRLILNPQRWAKNGQHFPYAGAQKKTQTNPQNITKKNTNKSTKKNTNKSTKKNTKKKTNTTNKSTNKSTKKNTSKNTKFCTRKLHFGAENDGFCCVFLFIFFWWSLLVGQGYPQMMAIKTCESKTWPLKPHHGAAIPK